MKAKQTGVLMALFLIVFLGWEGVEGQSHEGEGLKISFTSPPPGYPQLELDKLPSSVSSVLRETADRHTFYIVTENTLAHGSPLLYEYLFDNLPLSIMLLRELNLAAYTIYEESPQSYRFMDPKGLFGHFKLVYKEPGKRIYYGTGFYDSRMMPRIEGKAIMIFHYSPAKGKDSRFMINKVYGYVEVDSILYSTLARMLKPILPGLVKRKLNSLITSSKSLSERISEDPSGIYRMLKRSNRVPDENLLKFKEYFIDGRSK